MDRPHLFAWSASQTLMWWWDNFIICTSPLICVVNKVRLASQHCPLQRMPGAPPTCCPSVPRTRGRRGNPRSVNLEQVAWIWMGSWGTAAIKWSWSVINGENIKIEKNNKNIVSLFFRCFFRPNHILWEVNSGSNDTNIFNTLCLMSNKHTN